MKNEVQQQQKKEKHSRLVRMHAHFFPSVLYLRGLWRMLTEELIFFFLFELISIIDQIAFQYPNWQWLSFAKKLELMNFYSQREQEPATMTVQMFHTFSKFHSIRSVREKKNRITTFINHRSYFVNFVLWGKMDCRKKNPEKLYEKMNFASIQMVLGLKSISKNPEQYYFCGCYCNMRFERDREGEESTFFFSNFWNSFVRFILLLVE